VTVPIAIFASGRGSNFVAIFEAIRTKKLDAEIVAVVSDQLQATATQRARKRGLKTLVVPFEKEELRQVHEEKILAQLLPLGPKFLVMAGYMRIVTPLLIDSFRCDRGYSRMVNIHPSLLPAFPGVHAYGQAFQYGVKWTGVTVHLVENAVDSGPICAQEAFNISDCQSEAEVEERGLAVEHRLLPESLEWILPENFSIKRRPGKRRSGECRAGEHHSGGRFCVSPN
jgi:phosphoribosylglycinamide formyltransferase-1